MKHIQPTELKARLTNGGTPLLLDVREAWEHQTASIESSTLIPMREVAGRIAELNPEVEVVVICHHGSRSMQVAMFLERQGFSNVHNLTGGVDAWARTVDPSMPLY